MKKVRDAEDLHRTLLIVERLLKSQRDEKMLRHLRARQASILERLQDIIADDGGLSHLSEGYRSAIDIASVSRN